MSMGDKANTKHGNMVALQPFTALVVSANLTNSPYQIMVWADNASGTLFPTVVVPFAGTAVAIVHSGDFAYAGTWTFALKINDTVKEQTRTAVTADGVYWTASSPHAIQFQAGDSLSVVHNTSSDYASNDTGFACATIYVMFSNA